MELWSDVPRKPGNEVGEGESVNKYLDFATAIFALAAAVWSAAAFRPENAERPRIRRASVVLPAPPFVVAMVMMLIGTPLPEQLGCRVPMRLIFLQND